MRIGQSAVLLWALAVLSVAPSSGVQMYSCATPKGVEKHCVEWDSSSAPTYVKGVLPGAGYFEGRVVPGSTGTVFLARVDWYYAATAAFSGSATFQYTQAAGVLTSYSNKTSWGSGISDLRGGVETLASSTCTLVAQTASAAQLRECLYSAPGDLQKLKILLPNGLDGSHWASGAASGVTQMTICHRDVTTLVSLSHASRNWTGLQRDTLRFTGRDSYGLTGVWRSPSGEWGSLVVTTFVIQGQASLHGMSCNSTGSSCEAVSVALLSGVNGACQPRASPPPKVQYGACPEQDTFAEMVIEYTQMLECSRPTSIPPYKMNAGEEAKEYHCIDYDASSTPLYVKGTYGMRGYFEGPVASSQGVAVGRVAWYQTGGAPVAISFGSATVSYATTETAWTAWASDLNATTGTSSWSSTCTPVASPTPQLMSQKCLWSSPGRSVVSARVNALDAVKFESTVSDVTDIEMCHDDLSTNAAINTKYGDVSCGTASLNCSITNVENGTFSPRSVRLNLQDSYGLVGPWSMLAGPRGTASGGAIYVVTNSGTTLQGFECVVNASTSTIEGCEFKEYQVSAAPARCEVLSQRSCKLEMGWKDVRQRKLSSTAFSGGLGDLASDLPATAWGPKRQYGVWACLRDWGMYAQLKCGAGAGEHVCFKYDEVSEAFDSWGLNRDIRIVEPFV